MLMMRKSHNNVILSLLYSRFLTVILFSLLLLKRNQKSKIKNKKSKANKKRKWSISFSLALLMDLKPISLASTC